MLRSSLVSLCVFAVFVSSHLRADNWPQWLGPQRDGVWREQGILEKFPAGGPKVLWRKPIAAGYSGPAVVGGRVYVTDRVLAKGAKNPQNPFQRGAIAGTERVLCLNEANGETIWKHEYDCAYTISYPSGPRTTPVVHEGKVYALGAMGDLYCLNAASGKVIWSKQFSKEYGLEAPLWGWSATPLIDGDRLICIVGVDESVAVAFHKDTGKEIWKALSAREPGYCPPMIFEHGGKRQLIIWHPDAVNSLNPETGEVYWSEPFEIRSGLTIPTPRLAGNDLFVSAFYDGPLMLSLNPNRPEAKVKWRGTSRSERRTDKLHAIMCTPFIENDHIYGVCSYGQLRCLRADTGERLWETFAATTTGKEVRWANAFIVKHEDRFFLFNELGDLIIAKMSPAGYQEISRAHLLSPTNRDAFRDVVWSHPAFANGRCYARNDKEIICVSLRKE